jgi:hypothetical protein
VHSQGAVNGTTVTVPALSAGSICSGMAAPKLSVLATMAHAAARSCSSTLGTMSPVFLSTILLRGKRAVSRVGMGAPTKVYWSMSSVVIGRSMLSSGCPVLQ